MFTGPEHWHLRLRDAGGTVELTGDGMRLGKAPVSSECELIWNEIQGHATVDRRRKVEAYLRQFGRHGTRKQDV